MKIVILDGYTLNPGDLSWEPLKELGEVTVYERTAPKDICKRAEGAEVVFTNKVVLDEAVLEKLPSLKYIGVLATGYNVVDVAAAARKGIVVTNIPAYSTSSVAQMAFAHILNIVQRVGYYAQEVSNGKWSRQADFSFWDAPLHELDGKKMGIIGFGNTGRATARIAVGFGLDVYAYTSKSAMELPADVHKCPSMDELFRKCDIVSLHCPLTETTRELVDARKLELMKSSAILINTGRGGLVNEQDLADALNSGKIAAAGLDVLSSEPPRADNPLLKARNCFITPHQAWATKEARVRLMQLAVNNLKSLELMPICMVLPSSRHCTWLPRLEEVSGACGRYAVRLAVCFCWQVWNVVPWKGQTGKERLPIINWYRNWLKSLRKNVEPSIAANCWVCQRKNLL